MMKLTMTRMTRMMHEADDDEDDEDDDDEVVALLQLFPCKGTCIAKRQSKGNTC